MELTSSHARASSSDIRRWRRYLADEQAEAAVYRDLASRREGEEREILLALADAELRHEEHWRELLGPGFGPSKRSAVRTTVLGFFARRFGSVFVLALAQRAESRSPYESDSDATPAMAADERIHAEVVRALATRGRLRLAGTFRAAVFGANDGLVSNLALVLGIAASGVPTGVVLLTGVAGLLAGALSMGAGEYVSVSSQRELLNAGKPNPEAANVISDLDVNANELTLVFRARGMSETEAAELAAEVLREHARGTGAIPVIRAEGDSHEAVGTGMGAAVSSFCFFSSGAIIPILPFLFGMEGLPAILVSSLMVGIALLLTGAIVGLLSGASPTKRAFRQLAIGFGAAAVTYILGLLLGTSLG